MTAHPLFFGPDDAPLFGWLHLPDSGVSRGGVVLCPTLAVESYTSYRALRWLAIELERRGLSVIRFDYPGTGDSAGVLDERSTVDGLVEGIGQAVSLLRSSGVDDVGIVGLRIGALLAAKWCQDNPGAQTLLLWDPPASGRAYLRQQQALLHVALPNDEEKQQLDGTELLGLLVPERLSAEISALKIEPAAFTGLKQRPFVLARSDRKLSEAVTEVLVTAGAEFYDALGQSEFLDVLPDRSQLPLESMSKIVAECDASFGDSTVSCQEPISNPWSVVSEPGLPIVRERPVVFGGLGLFGIITEPEGDRCTSAIVLPNAGVLHHAGPARLWVELSRQLAASGMRVLRFDLGGLGDSGDRPGAIRQQTHPIGAIDDMTAAMKVVSPLDQTPVVLAGLCSGAYHALETAVARRVDGVVALNPILSFTPPEGRDVEQRAAVQPYRRSIDRLRSNQRLVRLAERFVPALLWDILDITGIQRTPARSLQVALDSGAELFVVCGQVEALPFTRRGRLRMRRMAQSSAFSFKMIRGADHTLFGAVARAQASALVVEYLVQRNLDRRGPLIDA